MKKRMFVAGALALAAGSIAAGCGGGDDDTTTAALSKQEFLRQGNQLCAAGAKAISTAEDKVGPNPSQAEVEEFATKTAIPTIQFEISGLEALPAPKGDENQVAAITSGAQQALDKLKADPSLITSAQENPFAETNKLAKQYGLTACAG